MNDGPVRLSAALLLASSVLLVQPLSAQQGQLTDVEILHHVFEPQRVAPTDARIATLTAPAGFHVQRFAEGLDNPRMIAVAEDGTIYITQRKPGNVVMLRDADGDGVADLQRIVARIKDVHGIEIRGREIYLADIKRIYGGDLMPNGSIRGLRVLVRGMPDGGQHPNRTLEFSPDGKLFVSIGSTCNECREPNPLHATIQRVQALDDGRDASRTPFALHASGLRNALGFGWHPGSGRMYAFDNGIDALGDDEQSEELNEIGAGQRYGWPYVYDEDQINPHTEPLELTSEQWAALSEEPVGLYTAHAAPMQMTFYTGAQFPLEFRNDALIPMRGSWNRKPASGYEVLRVRFSPDGDFQAFEPFVTGFLTDGGQAFFGRPVGAAVARDGALLVGDDTNNILYRVAHGEPTGAPSPQALASAIFSAPATIRVSSPAIAANGPIPRRYTDYGRGVSPPLAWSHVPSGAKTLVLLMEDPDAIAPLPFVHWTMVNIPAGLRSLPENVRKSFRPPQPEDALQGSNSKSERGYFGPRPPPGDPPHRYHFQVFALDTTLALPDGFNRRALLEAMEGRVLAQGELVGAFQQPKTAPSP
jgi:Raf kinase inhibitor-like YbhB/YbcL family protein